MSHRNYSKKVRRHPKQKNGKTQRGGMKVLLAINLHELYESKAINALFRDDREGRDVSKFFIKTEKTIQMPDGLEAKLYDNGQLCFNSKKVKHYPDWMNETFQLNGIVPSPEPEDCMKTILSVIPTIDNEYKLRTGRTDLLCMVDKFAIKHNMEMLKPFIDQFVVKFIKTYKHFIELTAQEVHTAKKEQIAQAEESSLSFLDDFNDTISAVQSQFISERRKNNLMQLKAGALTAHDDMDMIGFKNLMSEFIRKLIELDYIMKYCLVNDQAEFDACKMVAENKGIVNATIDKTPSILIHSAKLLVKQLKQQLKKSQPQPQTQLVQPSQPPELPQLSQADWMDQLFTQSPPNSSPSPPKSNQFDDLLPAGGGKRTTRTHHSKQRRSRI